MKGGAGVCEGEGGGGGGREHFGCCLNDIFTTMLVHATFIQGLNDAWQFNSANWCTAI